MAGLYIHIPFCRSKCIYCDFFSSARTVMTGRFIDALISELRTRAGAFKGKISTIYVGGGTPSTLPYDVLQRLLLALGGFDVSEFTVEVNPEDVTPELTKILVGNGVDRVSMGVQSLSDVELRAVGRRHTSAQALEAISTLRRGGVGNLSVDLIYGLPLQTPQSWQQSLDRMILEMPEHMSAYALSVEESTPLGRLVERGKVAVAGDDDVAEMYARLCESAVSAGYEHYEIANFARGGFRSRHNSAYWDFSPYLGLGPGAHSFDGHTRRYNVEDIGAYLTDPIAASRIDEESEADRENDFLMVGLRTADGVDLDTFGRLFGADELRRVEFAAEPLISSGDIVRHGSHLRIPERRWLVSDSIIIELMR